MKLTLKTISLGLLAAALVTTPAHLGAQTNTNKVPSAKTAPTDKKDSDTKKKSGHPFHGKLAALDKAAKTITVGKTTYEITSETKIKKAGQPATLADGVVGEEASGYARPADDGKMAASSVNFGPKAETKTDTKSSEKKK